jgi:hypothetical protein
MPREPEPRPASPTSTAGRRPGEGGDIPRPAEPAWRGRADVFRPTVRNLFIPRAGTRAALILAGVSTGESDGEASRPGARPRVNTRAGQVSPPTAGIPAPEPQETCVALALGGSRAPGNLPVEQLLVSRQQNVRGVCRNDVEDFRCPTSPPVVLRRAHGNSHVCVSHHRQALGWERATCCGRPARCLHGGLARRCDTMSQRMEHRPSSALRVYFRALLGSTPPPRTQTPSGDSTLAARAHRCRRQHRTFIR